MPFFAFLLGSFTTAHAVPVQLNQQGRLLDVNGATVTGIHTLTFKIFDAQFGGNALWQDNVQVAFDDGYYTTLLGGNPSNLLDDGVLSTGAPLYLEMEFNGGGPIGARQGGLDTLCSPVVLRLLDGGSVDASDIHVNGQVVIDASGSWVGPAMMVSGVMSPMCRLIWQMVMMTLWVEWSAHPVKLPGWNGSAWICVDDNGLSESEVLAYVENWQLVGCWKFHEWFRSSHNG